MSERGRSSNTRTELPPKQSDSVTRMLDEIVVRERYEPNPPGRELARRVVTRAKKK